MKRWVVPVWLGTVIAAVACAQGSSLDTLGLGGDVGAGGSGAGGTGGSGSSSSGSSSSTSSTSTTGVTGSSSSSSSTSSTSGSTSSSSSTSSTSSTSSSSSSSGTTGFGPCVTQAQIDAQSTLPFELAFCVSAFPAACLVGCPNDAVSPGDLVCGPNCVCAPLPPLCASDAGTD